MLLSAPLEDARTLVVAHAAPADAAIVAYVERVSSESDYLTFGPGEFGISVDDETKSIASLADGSAGFMLKGTVDGVIVSTCTLMHPRRSRVRHVGVFGRGPRRFSSPLPCGRGGAWASWETLGGEGRGGKSRSVRSTFALAPQLRDPS